MTARDLPVGVRYGVPLEEYHADTASVSKSGLDLIERSPYHYWAAHLDPNRPPRPEPTPAMRLGTLVHCMALEPDQVARRYVDAPECDRRTTAGKATWAAFLETLGNREAIDTDTMSRATAMALAIHRIAPVRDLLAAGHAEVSAHWVDASTGLLCRIRPDWVHPAGNGVVIFDLKTCVDASPKGFARAVANFNYAKQAAFYSDGWTAATGQTVHGFVFGAVEKEHPYAAAAYMLDEAAIEQGRRQYRRNLETLASCHVTNFWPGYTTGDEVQLLQLPAWAMEKEPA